MTDITLGVVTIPVKHQITIPKRVMQDFGWKENDNIEFINRDGTLILKKQPV